MKIPGEESAELGKRSVLRVGTCVLWGWVKRTDDDEGPKDGQRYLTSRDSMYSVALTLTTVPEASESGLRLKYRVHKQGLRMVSRTSERLRAISKRFGVFKGVWSASWYVLQLETFTPQQPVLLEESYYRVVEQLHKMYYTLVAKVKVRIWVRASKSVSRYPM